MFHVTFYVIKCNPANNTTGTAIFSFLSSIITELLILIHFNYNKNEIFYEKILFDWFGKKQSTVSPFLNLSLPEGSITQIFDWINDLIRNDSWPFKISTSNLPLLVVLNLLFTNRVKSNFFLNSFLNLALKEISFFIPSKLLI